jgi:hypothetical protein
VEEPAIWATRFSEMRLTENYSLKRKWGNIFFVAVSRIVTRKKFSDPGSAICALNLQYLEDCSMEKFSDGLHFHPQLNLFLSAKLFSPPREIPMPWKDASHRIEFSLFNYGSTLLLIYFRFYFRRVVLRKVINECF